MENKSYNRYLRYAKRIKFFRYFIIVIFALFVFCVVSLFKDEITIENFRYLIKYIDVDTPQVDEEFTKINFESNVTSYTGMYKNDLVVVTKNSISIYDVSGRKVFGDSFTMSNPAFAISDRYIAVYDLGSNNIIVYNFFSRLWEHTFDYPIYNVDINDNGDFCVVSAAKGYHSAVYVYNNDFESVYNWYSADKYVYDISICDDDGSKIALACVKASNGNFLTEVINLSTDSKQIEQLIPFSGEMAIDIEYLSDKNILLLTDSSMKFISKNEEDIVSFGFVPNSLRKYSIGENCVALVLNEDFIGSRYTVNLFSVDGEIITTQYVEENISDIDVGNEKVYILAIENVYSLAIKNCTLEKFGVDRSYKSIHAFDEDVVFLVLDNFAVATRMSEDDR